MNPFLLASMIVDNHVNSITCTPTFLSNIVGIPACAQALRQIDFYDIGSEAFPKNLYLKLRALREDSVIINAYGPTECTMGCAATVMGPEEEITIGGPIVNTKFYVMDGEENCLGIGEKGELIISDCDDFRSASASRYRRPLACAGSHRAVCRCDCDCVLHHTKK